VISVKSHATRWQIRRLALKKSNHSQWGYSAGSWPSGCDGYPASNPQPSQPPSSSIRRSNNFLQKLFSSMWRGRAGRKVSYFNPDVVHRLWCRLTAWMVTTTILPAVPRHRPVSSRQRGEDSQPQPCLMLAPTSVQLLPADHPTLHNHWPRGNENKHLRGDETVTIT